MMVTVGGNTVSIQVQSSGLGAALAANQVAVAAAAEAEAAAALSAANLALTIIARNEAVAATANKVDLDGDNITDPEAFRDAIGVRQVTPGGVTYYVRTDGNDANTGLVNTAGGAFLTIQRAVNAAYAIDAKGSVVQINIADGTYSGAINIYGRLVGAFDNTDQPFRIIGNEATPANVVIATTGQDALRGGDKATVLIAGVTLGTVTSGNAIYASNGAQIQHRNLRFINCAGEMILTTGKAFVQAIGSTTVAGNAVSFVHATNNSIVSFGGQTLTFSGSPTFSTYVYGINTSVVDLSSATIVGKALGGITVHVNSILNVSSCTGVWTGGQPMFVSNGGLISAEDKVATRQFYVRLDATSPNNSGFDNTADGAFPSIQTAINRLAEMPYDLVGSEAAVDASYDWQINVAAGDFSGESITLKDTRFSRVTIRGASTSTTFAKDYTSRAIRTAWTVDNQRLGGAANVALSALDGAQITFKTVSFTGSAFFGLADNGGRLLSSGPFTIAGASSASFYARNQSLINLNASVVTVTGTPALGTFALLQGASFLSANGTTFSGAATGTRYSLAGNSVCDTNGAATTLFPGNAVGTTATGGQYV